MANDPDNYDRAGWADEAIVVFMRVTGTDRIDALGDLLADLMHWADREGASFATALTTARGHYQEEIDESPPARPTRRRPPKARE